MSGAIMPAPPPCLAAHSLLSNRAALDMLD
jgi:hypothetical protein